MYFGCRLKSTCRLQHTRPGLVAATRQLYYAKCLFRVWLLRLCEFWCGFTGQWLALLIVVIHINPASSHHLAEPRIPMTTQYDRYLPSYTMVLREAGAGTRS